ncbi:MAG TPA: sugar ABC transporter ATP-binding protein [Pseudomonadales bacterium]|nr:sugar ABC transporter ATP-binding protein [Pseudomonadales bacterium]
MAAPRLAMSGVRKAFGSTEALRGVNISVAPGEVHALIGENGAGKSTLMNVLSGACTPDAGSIELDGSSFRPGNPLHARRAGIAMIHQELTLAPHLTVEQNILLGREYTRWGWIRSARCRDAAASALSRLGRADLPLDVPVGSLSLADRQVVEIARALVGNPTVLVMDEATSSLGPADALRLFRVIEQLKSLGVAIVYISHFLEECQQVCDRYTVLRDGETVASGPMRDATLPELIRLMVGRSVETLYPVADRTPGEVVLDVAGLRGRRAPDEVTFTLRRGEILGIAGLVGAGRTETLRTLFGLDPMLDGRVSVHARPSGGLSPRQRLHQGIGLTSENRKDEGLLLNRSIADNLTLTRFDTVARLGFVSRSRHHAAAQRQIDALGIKAARPSQSVGELSGGNQQKVALGRLLHHDAEILLLDEPTRGIDVASKAEIYSIVSELARRGRAIVFVSSYLPELLGVCDTIGVMHRGRLTAIRPARAWTGHDIMTAALGQSLEQAS